MDFKTHTYLLYVSKKMKSKAGTFKGKILKITDLNGKQKL